jgi:hypothetical protein
VAYPQVEDALRALPSGAASDAEHAHWREALLAWVGLLAGTPAVDAGGHTDRYGRFPFLAVYSDVDPTDLDDLGRRGLARAGLLANVLAGVVLPDPRDVPAR